jgi:hypothetical protein
MVIGLASVEPSFIIKSVLFDISISTKPYKSAHPLGLGIPQSCNVTNERGPPHFDYLFCYINGQRSVYLYCNILPVLLIVIKYRPPCYVRVIKLSLILSPLSNGHNVFI